MASLPARIAATATALVLHALFFCLSIPFLLTPLPQWRTRLLHHLNCSLPLRLNPLLCLAVSQPPSRTTAPSSRIIVANHSSPIDFAIIAGVFPTARFLARADQLQFPIVGWVLKVIPTPAILKLYEAQPPSPSLGTIGGS
jgi:1-acyl-sn-glycerol-3-phosphate acyltransferase